MDVAHFMCSIHTATNPTSLTRSQPVDNLRGKRILTAPHSDSLVTWLKHCCQARNESWRTSQRRALLDITTWRYCTCDMRCSWWHFAQSVNRPSRLCARIREKFSQWQFGIWHFDFLKDRVPVSRNLPFPPQIHLSRVFKSQTSSESQCLGRKESIVNKQSKLQTNFTAAIRDFTSL